MTPIYPIHEIFHTWQGEGVHMGKPAFFIRLFGCPVKCPWCDSAGTWHKDFIPKDIKKMAAVDIAGEASKSGAKIAVITGGEPCIHDLRILTGALHGAGLRVHLETSGAFELTGHLDWVTLSPKKWKMPLKHNIRLAQEFKIIVEEPADIDFYWNFIYGAGPVVGTPVWLHPEWSHSEDGAVLDAISEAVKKGDRPFRAGAQLHKFYQVDKLDKRSRPLVPLGGNIDKGY